MLRKPFTSLYALCTYQAQHLLGLEREPLACHTPIPRMSYHHTQQDAMQQHTPHLEGLELEALVLFGEVIEVHLDQLVRHMVDVRPPARRRDAVDERHLYIIVHITALRVLLLHIICG